MEYLNLFLAFDTALQKCSDDKKRKQLLLKMLMIELKYNLDMIEVIKLKSSDNDTTQLREIIKKLSHSSIEKFLIEYNDFDYNSFINAKLGQVFESATSLLKKNQQEYINPEDGLLLNLYKRIIVLKALADLQEPYKSIKKLNFKTRINNLKKVLVEITKKQRMDSK